MITKDYIEKKHHQLLSELHALQALLEMCDVELTENQTEEVYDIMEDVRNGAQGALGMLKPYL